MKILLSAFACDPVTGSEPYVGWNWANRLAASHHVTVLTRTYSYNLIKDHHSGELPFGIVHFDLPFCSKRDHYWRFIALYYVIWQIVAFVKVCSSCLPRKMDLVHHLTYNAVDMPGLLHLVPGLRFIWGPVGGGQLPPKSLKVVYGSAWPQQRVRAFLKTFAKMNPLVLMATRKADHVFFANKETSALLSRRCRSWSILLETAIDVRQPSSPPRPKSGNALWLGLVIDRKALMLAIDAFAQAISGGAEGTLVVAGDGPLLASARHQAAGLGIAERVRFLGRVPFHEVEKLIDQCDFMVFSSVQDTSGNVIFEAMARGKPVVALDHQGAAEIIGPGCGIKVPVGSYEKVVAGFADAILELSEDEAARLEMGQRALKYIIDEHSWGRRLDEYDAIIRRIWWNRPASNRRQIESGHG